MTKFPVIIATLLAMMLPGSSRGALIGDPAEPLNLQAWLKGPPAAVKPGTNIFLIEIWQTTGPASRAAITNLNRLQARFQDRGLVVIGVSDEPAEIIGRFLQQEGTNIQYRVAADQHRATAMAYMEPARQIGVPYAFIVGTNGALLWHGHVFAGLDRALDQIFAGTYDLGRAQGLETADRQMEDYIALARRGDRRLPAAGNALLANRAGNFDLLCDLAFQISTDPRISARDFALAGRALDQAQNLAPTNSAHLLSYRAVWLFQAGHRTAGLEVGQRALDAARTPAEKANVQSLLNTMQAWTRASTNHLDSTPAKP